MRHNVFVRLGMAALAMAAVFCVPAFSDSTTVSYQGQVRNTNGTAVPDGAFTFGFSIWDALTGGNQLWQETHSPLAIKGGRFSVQLGDATDLGTLFTVHSALWLEIAVDFGYGYETYAPRVSLTSVPYAKQADNATTANSAANATHASSADSATNAGHASSADSATSATTATNATNATNATTATNATNAGNADTVDNLHAAAFWALAGNAPGASDFLGSANAADLVIKTNGTERMRVQSGGNVGIGKTPTTTLDVAGGIKSTMWKVTKAIAYGGGPYPRSGSFTSSGGTLMIFASAGAYSATTAMQVDVLVDGTVRTSLKGYTNETSSHKALSADPVVLPGITAGSHTVQLNLAAGAADTNDYSQVTVLEVPF